MFSLALGDPFPALSDGEASDDEPSQLNNAAVDVRAPDAPHALDPLIHRLTQNLAHLRSLATSTSEPLAHLSATARSAHVSLSRVRSHSESLAAAQDSLGQAAKAVDDTLGRLSCPRDIGPEIRHGPHNVADRRYLSRVRELGQAKVFLEESGKGFRSFPRAMEEMEGLVQRAAPLLEGDVEKLVGGSGGGDIVPGIVEAWREEVKRRRAAVARAAKELAGKGAAQGSKSSSSSGRGESGAADVIPEASLDAIPPLPRQVMEDLEAVCAALVGLGRFEYVSKYADARGRALDARLKELCEALLHAGPVDEQTRHHHKSHAHNIFNINLNLGGSHAKAAGVPGADGVVVAGGDHCGGGGFGGFHLPLSSFAPFSSPFSSSSSSSSSHSHAHDARAVYTRGAHGLIGVVRGFLRLVSGERDLATRVIAGGMFDDALAQIQAHAVQRLCEVSRRMLAQAKRSPARTLVTLDLMENMATLLPRVIALLATGQGCAGAVRLLAADFVEAAGKALAHLEEEIRAHAPKAVPHDGTVHALASNTMASLRRLLDYRRTLEIFLPGHLAERGVADRALRGAEAIALFFARVIAALRENLERKAESYSKEPLRRIFLLNNYSHILRAVRSDPLQLHLAPPVGEALEQALKTERVQYRTATWRRAVGYLADDVVPPAILAAARSNPNAQLSKAQRHAIKACFNGFNEVFHEIYFSQKGYTVPDAGLREQLREDSRQLVLPRYKRFYETYEGTPFTVNKGKYVKYAPEVLEDMLGKFFEFSS